MTPEQVLHEIVLTDKAARTIYDEAVSLQTGLNEYLDGKLAALKSEHFKRADEDVEKVRVEEEHAANEAIARLNEQLDYELDCAKAQYESTRAKIIDKFFDIAVCKDA